MAGVHSMATNARPKLRKAEKIWQELMKNENDEIEIVKVVDFGITKSARTPRRCKTLANTTNPRDTTALGVRRDSESAGTRRTRTEKIEEILEVGEIEKKSQECEDSVETARVESSKHLWKKTFRNSPVKVNIVSNIGSLILQPKMLTTPTKLKRLKPRPKIFINARLDPSPRKPQDSSTNFSSLLTHWENYSTSAAPMLTPSQHREPNLGAQQTANQSQDNKKNLESKTSVIGCEIHQEGTTG
jgi:hypothetical protein